MNVWKTLTTGPLVLASVAMASAQPAEPSRTVTGVDSRWRPWIGCWTLVEESERREQGGPGDLSPGIGAGEPAFGRMRVCVTPADTPASVRLMTSMEGKSAFEDVIVADGVPHPTGERGCRGTEQAEWSRSGTRLFSRAELTCPGEKPYTVSHLAVLHGDIWLDVLSVAREGREGVRVRRHRREDDDKRARAVPGSSSGSFTIEDVREMSPKLSPLVVQAALVETNAWFPLDGRALMELDRAGVADEVTDLMVALSFPGTFKVDRPRPSGAGPPSVHGYEDVDVWGYAPFMYSYGGVLNPFSYPGFVIFEPDRGEDGRPPDGNGRVITAADIPGSSRTMRRRRDEAAKGHLPHRRQAAQATRRAPSRQTGTPGGRAAANLVSRAVETLAAQRCHDRSSASPSKWDEEGSGCLVRFHNEPIAAGCESAASDVSFTTRRRPRRHLATSEEPGRASSGILPIE
jgi:hypothetical protein